MMSEVQSFTETVSAHQQEIVDQRKAVGDELVEHMLKLPGMSDLFDTEQDRQMLGQQLVNAVEFASRQKAEAAARPEEMPPVPFDGDAPTNGDAS
jgi:hypothetical protein